MGLFDLIRKKPDNTENKDLTKKTGDSLPKDLLTSSEQLLMEVSTDLSVRDSVRLPISEIATLGGAFSSLLPSLRTITQTASTSGGGLYQLANASIGDALKASIKIPSALLLPSGAHYVGAPDNAEVVTGTEG